jgi:2-polyprenyl-3-methyl-5-hydroxy-6-metoxy-1,4-benzoquinol methylase
MSRFSQRCEDKELMDDLECSGEELEQTLKELKTINKLLGGNYVTTNGLRKLIGKSTDKTFSVADIGCGGGDMIRVMDDWAISHDFKLKFTGIDANRNIIDLAKVRLADKPEIDWTIQNVFDPAFSNHRVDIITCTLFTHHFTSQELVDLLSAFRKKAKVGIIINDLHRHPFAYHSIKWLTRIFSRSKMVQNDAPLSVLRSFSREDWENILKASGFKSWKIKWYWAFRWQILISCVYN